MKTHLLLTLLASTLIGCGDEKNRSQAGEDASGVIAIQHHGEKGQTYRFRNLRIKEV
ncbi:MAG: hypothetical protein ACJAT6_000731 [Akkermansiaceae bacterium]|jgi:hypothetical protein|tara:strand:+ start:14070 stop:14240 length:171 start_codon:yes stop_codon:yes gene_type:complete